MTGVPWYNTFVCKKLHGKVFEGFNIKQCFQKNPFELPKKTFQRKKSNHYYMLFEVVGM